MIHSSTVCTEPQQMNDTLRRFKVRKKDFEQRLQAVRVERDDLRHMVSIPLNPRCKQQPLLDDEKDSRLVEIFVKVDKGHYFEQKLTREISERLMSKLWEMHF